MQFPPPQRYVSLHRSFSATRESGRGQRRGQRRSGMEAALIGQRMEGLETAVARVSATKQALRENAASLKQEIRDCFGAQLSLVRGREAQLLASLDAVATCKEEILAEQQDQLHQALGAARQSLDCLSLDGSSAAAADTLHRLAAIPLRPRETAALGFTADGPALRRLLHSFGRITSTARRPQDRDPTAGHSLPSEAEDYDEEETSSNLSHKTLSRPASTISWSCLASERRDSGSEDALWTKALTSTLPRPNLDAPLTRTLSDRRKNDAPVSPSQLGHWLTHIKHETEPEPTVFEDFHLLQKQCEVPNSGNGDGFDSVFQRVRAQPFKDWLVQSQPPSPPTSDFDLCDGESEMGEAEEPNKWLSNLSNNKMAPPANLAWMGPREMGDEESRVWLAHQQSPTTSPLKTPTLQFPLPLWSSKTAWLAYGGEDVEADNGGRGEADEAMEEALGWNAVLESVHGRGDQAWLAMP